jgi:hypothetical protein
MKQTDNYLSEFEQEFELDDYANPAREAEFEMEEDLAAETDEEFEMYGDQEAGAEDHEDMLYEHGFSGDYEQRLYNALNNEYESNYEMEQAVDGILYEMEIEYFWKPFKKVWNKYKGTIGKAVKNFVPGDALKALSSLAGGDLRGLLKNDLVKRGLSMAANAVAPGMGGMVAGALLNREAESFGSLRNKAAGYVNMARNAYQTLAANMPRLKPGDIPGQLSALSKMALGKAQQAIGGGEQVAGNKRIIALPPGARVIVSANKVIICYR